MNCNRNILNTKKEFISIFSVSLAAINTDTINGLPRTLDNGCGWVSVPCMHRLMRTRMQDMGQPVFSQTFQIDDGYSTMKEREENELKGIQSAEEYLNAACLKWLDVRTFGQIFAPRIKGINTLSVKGPLTISPAISISPIIIETQKITKSCNGDPKSDGKEGLSKDRMGSKSYVRFGLYMVHGTINPYLAEKTGFTYQDEEIVKECIRTLFVNDASSLRPAGSVEMVKTFWFNHNCKSGQYSPAQIRRSVKCKLKDGVVMPLKVEDYDIIVEPLPGLDMEIIEGF